MRFIYRAANGSTCCDTDDPRNLCAACKARAGVTTTARTSHRTAAARDVRPPDPYAAFRAPEAARASVRALYSNAGRLAARSASALRYLAAPPPDSYALALQDRKDAR